MNVQLSKRMQAVADMALPGYRVADIGCDHGFVSIYLIQENIAPHVYAADVRPGPLSRAKEHIAQAGLEEYITPVLSDGLANVPVDDPVARSKGTQCKETRSEGTCGTGAQAVVAAGIGGRLTIKILSDWPDKTKKLSWMVLEPQSDIHLVRRWLAENGFFILKENMVCEDGKYYPILFAVNEAEGYLKEQIAVCRQKQEEYAESWAAAGNAKESWSKACDVFGFSLIISGNEVLKAFIGHTMEKDREILEGMGDSAAAAQGRIALRRAELSDKIRLSENVLKFMKTVQ